MSKSDWAEMELQLPAVEEKKKQKTPIVIHNDNDEDLVAIFKFLPLLWVLGYGFLRDGNCS